MPRHLVLPVGAKVTSRSRADTRLGSAHARNYRGSIFAIRGRKCDTGVLPSGTILNKSLLNEEKENAGVRFNGPTTIWPSAHDDYERCSDKQSNASIRSSDTTVIIVQNFALEHTWTRTKQKTLTHTSDIRTTAADGTASAISLLLQLLAYTSRDWYVSVRKNKHMGYVDIKTKTEPAAGRRNEHRS